MRALSADPIDSATDPRSLRFATGSDELVKEATLVLPFPVQRVAVEFHELQTTDVEARVRSKAEQAWRHVRSAVMVEDTGLRFLAWRQMPGPLIKHFVENLGLLGTVDALSPSKDWRAEAVTGVGYCDGAEVHYFEGRVNGMIVLPAGKEAFGWDAIFRPHGSGRTYGEMSREEKSARSMRTVALRKLAAFLAEQHRSSIA
jgi:non-canonical purine NTP pyrophosphatase (RdgB/HAM1 family)